MFSKIDKFGVARPFFCPSVFNIFDDSLKTSCTPSSDECVMYPEKLTSPPRCRADNFTCCDRFTDFTTEFSSSEVTESSESSINSRRAAINIMLTRDIFGYGRKRNASRNCSRELPEVNVEMSKNTESLRRFHVSSSDSSSTYRSGTLNFTLFDFIGDSSENSLGRAEKNSTNVKLMQNPRRKASTRTHSTSIGPLLRKNLSEHSVPSSSEKSFESVLVLSPPPEVLKNARTLSNVETSNDALRLRKKRNKCSLFENSKCKQKSLLSSDCTSSNRMKGRLAMDEILNSFANKGEESDRKVEESDDTLDLSVMNAEFQRRFQAPRQKIENSSDKHRSFASFKGSLDSLTIGGEESDRKDEQSDDTLDLSIINAEFQRRFEAPRQVIENHHEEMHSSHKHKLLALNGFEQNLPIRRNPARNRSNERSLKRPFEMNIHYGVRSDVKAPILTVNDFEEPRSRSGRKNKENNDTSLVPFRSGENDEDIDFMAEVQLIIQEFRRRMKRLS